MNAQIGLPVEHPSEILNLEELPTSMGLSQNMILCVLQDQQGFLWVGTKDGLNRFDGYRFKTFRNDPFDFHSLSDNRIEKLLEDSQGRLWVMTGRGLHLFDAKQARFHRITSPDSVPLENVSVLSFVEDNSGHLWMGTYRYGLLRLRPKDGPQGVPLVEIDQYKYPPHHPSYLMAGHPKHIVKDGNGTLWVRARNNLARLQVDSLNNILSLDDDFSEMADPIWQKTLQDAHFQHIGKGHNGKVWIGISRSLVCWDPTKQQFSIHPIFKQDVGEFWSHKGRDIFEDSQGNVWISHFDGLIKYNSNTGEIHNYRGGPQNPLLASGIESVYEDQSGLIWVATRGQGLCKLSTHTQRFAATSPTTGEAGRWLGASVRTLFKGSNQQLWVGLDLGELFRWDTLTQTLLQVPLPRPPWWEGLKEEFSPIVFDYLETHPDSLWLVLAEGLYQMTYNPTSGWSGSLKRGISQDVSLWGILPARENAFWMLSNTSLYHYQPKTDSLITYEYLQDVANQAPANVFPTFFCDYQEDIWIGSPFGLFHFSITTEEFQHYTHHVNDRTSLNNEHIKSIAADPYEPERYLWVGTAGGGLNRFDRQTQIFRHFGLEEGLPDLVVYSILTDPDQQFWISTNKGLAVFDPKLFTCRHFGKVDGLQDSEFNSLAAYQGVDGEFFFGGIKGFNRFYPESMLATNPNLPRVVFTDFKVANQSITEFGVDSPLQHDVSQAQTAHLNWNEKVFSIEFAALDFFAPSKHQFAYRMEGFDNDWQYVGSKHEATYTNLSPGDYTFSVKATNSDGLWNETPTTLNISIHPPWWLQWWAYALYVLIPLVLLYYFWRSSLQRQHLRHELAMEHLNTQQLTEINTLKARFYTNITHEFRTPLTVILGLTKQIETQPERYLKEGIQLIRRNGRSLLNLINQLLDLSKLEESSLQLEYRQGDVIAFLAYLTKSFHSYANERNLSVQFHSNSISLKIPFPSPQLRQVMVNLLSNAIKYSTDGGLIKVVTRSDDKVLLIKVQDQGMGIPPEELPHIFERFYQGDHRQSQVGMGTGIGLAHTKELVELMGGQIGVESIVDQGSTFSISLPIRTEEEVSLLPGIIAPESDHEPLVIQEKTKLAEINTGGAAPDAPLLLLVEDNYDVVHYLRTCLEDFYRLEIAYNGKIGLEKAYVSIPDIIISDVMMPEMDGYELCSGVKTDERTAHIPVILLTAKAEQSAKLSGLKTGADAYLTKPFDQEELLIRISNLLEVRSLLQHKQQQLLETSSPEIDPFIQKVLDILEEHIQKESFGLPQLSEQLNLSRSQLFRKMKALIDDSPANFIRRYRLQKARHLLQTTDHTVAQAAYEVGFKDASHFSKLFQKEFGILPSEVAH